MQVRTLREGSQCPSVWQFGTLANAFVENGHLVLWIDGYIEDLIQDLDLDHGIMARGAAWCGTHAGS